MNTQAKFMKLLAEECKARGLDLIDDAAYANTGTLRVQAPGRFVDILSAAYDFQGGSYDITLRWTNRAMQNEAHEYAGGRPDGLEAVLRGMCNIMDGKS